MDINQIYKRNFRFSATRYEEWQAGQCISQGRINCIITAEVIEQSIHFELSDKHNLRILDSFDFEFEGSAILQGRIQYVHDTADWNPIAPIVCHLFIENGTISYVRFGMTNPDRLIEFYGDVIGFDQPSSNVRKAVIHKNVSAAQIVSELKSYGMFNTNAVMERAGYLYKDNSNVKTKEQAQNIIEALKLFVECNKLNNKDKDGNCLLKPKILMFIALCNYKIGNISQAYYVAQKAYKAIDEAEEDCPFEGVPRSAFGEDTIKELIQIIECEHLDSVDKNMCAEDIDENSIDTSMFETLMRESQKESVTSKQNIKSLIEAITHIQKQFSKIGEETGDVFLAFQNNQALGIVQKCLVFCVGEIQVWLAQ